jgi:hypothetical protein
MTLRVEIVPAGRGTAVVETYLDQGRRDVDRVQVEPAADELSEQPARAALPVVLRELDLDRRHGARAYTRRPTEPTYSGP